MPSAGFDEATAGTGSADGTVTATGVGAEAVEVVFLEEWQAAMISTKTEIIVNKRIFIE